MTFTKPRDRVLILDYGSQFTQLIARRVREERVFCEIHPPTRSLEWIRSWAPSAIVLSGGPSSVYEEDGPGVEPELLHMDVPVLGICYGMQLIAELEGGRVEYGKREYGRAELRLREAEGLFAGFAHDDPVTVWCSHGDHVDQPPEGYRVVASTEGLPVAAFRAEDRAIYGVQFHPEVAHTPQGGRMLSNFLFRVAGCRPSWTASAFVEESITAIREQAGSRSAICGLSGGVDSSVAATLVHRALGDRLTCIFVDNGLFGRASGRGWSAPSAGTWGWSCWSPTRAKSSGKGSPESMIPSASGASSARSSSACSSARHAKPARTRPLLVQGTLYPGCHRVPLGARPVRDDKDPSQRRRPPGRHAVRADRAAQGTLQGRGAQGGTGAGPPAAFVARHPFPGPGLAVRILGEVTRERLEVLRDADAIFLEEIRAAGLYDEIWQAFAVLLPVRSVGVMGDARTYECAVTLRAVTSRDGMTADWYRFPPEVLARASTRIINEVAGVNRVAYDISSKPPATIEWE